TWPIPRPTSPTPSKPSITPPRPRSKTASAISSTGTATSTARTDAERACARRLLYDTGKCPGGAEGSRTPDLVIANDALYQLSYGPDRQAGAEISGASGECQRVADETLAFGGRAARSKQVSQEFAHGHRRRRH